MQSQAYRVTNSVSKQIIGITKNVKSVTRKTGTLNDSISNPVQDQSNGPLKT